MRKLLTFLIALAAIAMSPNFAFAQTQMQSGAGNTVIGCDHYTPLGNLATATTKELVPLSSGKTIFVCGFEMHAAAATTVTLVYGTGTNCGTGVQNITDDFHFGALDGMVSREVHQGMKTAASNALCVKNSSTNAIDGGVYWTQF
jgi:hypothetical protein